MSCKRLELKWYTHLIILALDKGQLEAEFCRINSEDTWGGLSIKAVHRAARHTCHIHRELQSADDPMVTIGQGIL